jgi:hypothetical protein
MTGPRSCVNGTCIGNHVQVISEFQRSAHNPLLADPTTERRLFFFAQPFEIHNVGTAPLLPSQVNTGQEQESEYQYRNVIQPGSEFR